MKKHNIFKVLLLTILVVAVCTWIFPSAELQTTLIEGERAQVGLFDLFSYPLVAIQYFGYTLFYVLACGMFYGVANRIPAYHQLVDRIVQGFKRMENVFFGIVIVLVATIVSVTGISFPIIFVFPFIIEVILKMGYNKLMAASVTVGSVVAGIAGTTLGSMTTSYLNQLLGIEMFDEMISKVIILVIFIVLLIAHVIMYGRKTKNATIQFEEFEEKEEDALVKEIDFEEVKKEVVSEKVKKDAKKEPKVDKKVTSKSSSSKQETEKDTKKTTSKNSKKSSKGNNTSGKRGRPAKTRASFAMESETLVVSNDGRKKANIWPFVVIFDLVLIILGISVFDWSGLFEITWFTEATEAVTSYEMFGFPILAKLLGTFYEFGSWSLGIELPVLIIVATGLLGLVYWVKWSEFIDGVVEGAKKAFGPAMIMLLTYVVLVIVTYHPFQLIIADFLLGLTKGINVVTMTCVAIIASLFNVDLTYVAQSTIPFVQSVITDAKLYPLIGIIFQSVYGLMTLVAPTSFILLGTLSYLDVSYTQWLKHIWKLFLSLLAILVIIFLIILSL